MKNALMSYSSSDIGSVDGKVLLDKIVQGILDLREFCVHGRLRILNFRVNWNSNKSTPGPQDTRISNFLCSTYVDILELS